MSRAGSAELSASLAVLGLVIEEPDTASRVGQRLSERFRPARFAPSTAYMTLPRLEGQGMVRRIGGGGTNDARYEATEKGTERFYRWLRTSPTALPALREALHARINLARPQDLARVIEIVEREREACDGQYAAAQGRIAELRHGGRSNGTTEREWSTLVAEVVLIDEAMMWGSRAARLARLHATLEELQTRFASGGDTSEP